jgi:hypothetical protein
LRPQNNSKKEIEILKPIMVLGLVLIVLGALALAYQGITYTTHEKIIDLGHIQASADVKKTIPLPPLLGGLALAGGIALVIVGRKKS